MCDNIGENILSFFDDKDIQFSDGSRQLLIDMINAEIYDRDLKISDIKSDSDWALEFSRSQQTNTGWY